jgi:hypothetical protein
MKELIHQYGAWIVFALVFLESIPTIRVGADRGRRRKEQELAAAAERDIPGPLRAELSGEADG